LLRLADRAGAVTENAGARLIPADVIIAAYPQLVEGSAAATSWLDLLDEEQLAAGGWHHPGPALREYLAAAVAAARDHPYAVRLPHMPPLATVYLRQQASVSASVKDSVKAADDGAAGPEHLAAGRLEVTHVLDWTDHALIIGGPGAGKSSALRMLTHELGIRWLQGEPAEAVPVYVPAAELVSGTLSEGLAAGVSRHLASRLDRTLAPDLFTRTPVAGTPWLVLVDGIDEVLDPRARNRVYDTIAHHVHDPRYRFLLASRPLSDEKIATVLGKSPAFDLEPFSEDQLPEFARTWFAALRTPNPDDLARRFTAQVRRRRLRDHARTPLVATMLCVLFANSPDQDLPVARATLYRQFLTLLLDKGPDELDSYQQIRDRAGRYGHTAAQAAESLLTGLRDLLERLADQRMHGAITPLVELAANLTDHHRPTYLRPDRWLAILRDVLRHSGVLVERGTDFDFAHQTLQEYLSACHRASADDLDQVATSIADQVTRYRDAHDLEELHLLESFLLFQAGELAAVGHDMNPLVRDLLTASRPAGTWFAAELLLDGIDVDAQNRQEVCLALSRLTLAHATGVFWYSGVDAALQLADLDRERGLRALRDILQNPTRDPFDRVTAAGAVMADDPETGLRCLLQVAGQREIYPGARLSAAAVLKEHDMMRGAATLKAFVADTTMPLHLRVASATELSGGDETVLVSLLRQLTADPTIDGFDRIELATQAAKADAPAGRDMLLGIIADPGLSPTIQTTAIEALAELPPALAARALAPLPDDRTQNPDLRYAAAKCLLDVDQEAGGKALLAIAGDHGLPARTRIDAAFRAGAADPTRAVAALRGFLTDTSVRPLTRLAAAERIARLDQDTGLALLENTATDRGVAGFVRVNAAGHVKSWDPDLARRLLENLATDPGLDHEDRRRAEAELRAIPSSHLDNDPADTTLRTTAS
jgi:hypothetical protein